MPGLEESDRGIVVDRFGLHRADQAHVIGKRTDVRDQLAAHLSSCFAEFLKFPASSRQRKLALPGRHPSDPLIHVDEITQLFAFVLAKQWLWVEQFLLRRRTALEQIDNPFGFGRVVVLLQHAVGGREIGCCGRRSGAPCFAT